MLKLKSVMALSIALAITHTANAALVLDLRLDDTMRARSVASGSSVFIDMFLVDTDGTSATSVGPTAGLIGGGGRILDTPTGAAATGSFTTAGAGFTGPSSSPAGPGIASAEVAAPFLSFVASSTVTGGVTSLAGVGATEVLIARFAVTANGGAGDTHTLTATTLGAPSVGNVANGFPPTALDALLTASGATESVVLTVSAAAVPEPSTLFAGVLLACGAVFHLKRRHSSVPAGADC